MVHISFCILECTENSLQNRLFKSNFEINLLHSVRISLNDLFRTFFLFVFFVKIKEKIQLA